MLSHPPQASVIGGAALALQNMGLRDLCPAVERLGPAGHDLAIPRDHGRDLTLEGQEFNGQLRILGGGLALHELLDLSGYAPVPN